MKKQMLIGVGLASVLVLAGCETTQPQPKEVVNYSSTTYQGNGPSNRVDYAVRPDNNANQAEQRYLLQKPQVEDSNASAPQQTQVETAPQKPVQQAKQEVKEERPAPMVVKQRPRQDRIKITGVGYGAQSTYDGFTDGQKRLMAIRASKLDAYRSLAEQLYGIKIDSNTSVATMTAQSDSFRARVNAVVKGARIVSITPMSDNNYETVLEVFVDRRFFEDVFVYSGNQQDLVLEPMETCTLGFNCYEAASYR
ncbi:LPP20 family lipoprotein [Thiomicrospira sp.]|uniref:LPP20 family lipoprotein n=1 Tax=Thiomicrospira sp. TaxID=935 RepID=UPI0025CDF7BC|nr:LPP20 family lipoprotein [Thiomicrospira sp.]